MKHHEASHKQSAVPQSAIPKNDIGDGVDGKEMISVAAYYRSQQHGFGDSDPFLDWLAAEEEIDAMLKNHKEIKIS